jgi:hypothetical protein
MSPEQLQRFLELISLGKVPDDKASPDRVFLRGWNAALEFVDEQTKKVLAE